MSAPLIIDCFAGGGGASTGIERGLGRSPDVAINHNAAALALHAANHPDTLHLDSNIWDVDPETVAAGRPIALLWASPDCKHFSKAKGGAPKDRNIRDLAWAVVRWARLPRHQRPQVILMENVEEFRTWGPVCDAGQPIKGLEGVTFDAWVQALRNLGYKLDWRELRACDYGAPTIRKRLFMVARCDGLPIRWPRPTHGAPDSAAVRRGRLQPFRTAADCIDWSLPCPSIFDSAEAIKRTLGMSAKRPLAANTLARVARGMKRYVLDAQRPFIVNLTHGARLEDSADPFRTITGANQGEKAVVAPMLSHLYTSNKAGGQGSPEQPLKTVTAGGQHHALVAPSLVSIAHGDSGGRREYALSETLGVVTAGGISHAVAAPFLATMRNSQKPWQGADQPSHTITAGGAGISLIAPVLTYAQHGGACRDARAPHHTICANSKDQNSLLAVGLVQTGYGERPGQRPRALDIGAPLGTVVAGGAKHAGFAAFLAQHNRARQGVNPGRAADAPLSTLTASASQQNPVAAFFAKYYGTGDGARQDEPAHTVTVRDRFGHVQAMLGCPPFTDAHKARAREVAAFLRAHDAWDGGEFVTLNIDGETFVVVDIGLRMLTPRELFNAQGFPPDYVIDGVWHQDGAAWRFEAFTKSTQVSCCGNSVCPDVAAALAAANRPAALADAQGAA